MLAQPSASFTDRVQRLFYCLLPMGLGLAAALLLLLAASGPPRPAYAGTLTYPGCGTTIQDCINSANAGDTILITAGDYTESLTLSKAVSLTGALSSTTLHALPNTRVLTVTGAAVDSGVVISGLTFTGGDLPGFFGSCPEHCGGGVLITGSAQPRLSNLRLISNTAVYGAGLYANGDLTVSASSFISNVIGSMVAGGGLYVQGTATVANSSFINNYASSGGGLYATDATVVGSRFVGNESSGLNAGHNLTVTDSSFIDNYGDTSGGGLFTNYTATVSGTQFLHNAANTDGGGLAAGHVLVRASSFISNNAYAGGGGGLLAYATLTVSDTSFVSNAAQAEGGGLDMQGVTTATVNNSDFLSNTATQGGGLFANFLMLGDSRFVGNTASEGGGLAAYGVIATASHFVGNRTLGPDGGGGGIWSEAVTLTGTQFIGNSAQAGGGGVQVAGGGTTNRVVNSLFTGNRSDTGGADLDAGNTILLYDTFANPALAPGTSVFIGGNLSITDTIFASQTIAIDDASGSVFQDYNLFYHNGTNLSGTVSGGGHSLTSNPAFADPAHDDYHLTAGSAARGKGIDVGVTTDFEGDPRPSNGGFDIGFDQFLSKLFLPLLRR